MNELNDATRKVILTDVEEEIEKVKDVDGLSDFRSCYIDILREIGLENDVLDLNVKAQKKAMGSLYKVALGLARKIEICRSRNGERVYSLHTDQDVDIDLILGDYEAIAKKYGLPKPRIGRARRIVNSVMEKRKEDFKRTYERLYEATK